MSDLSIPAFLAGLNVDAVSWSEARGGDYILLRDPASRALTLADAFVICGEPKHTGSSMQAYTLRMQGNEAVGSWAFRKAAIRQFDSACWQVWRDFGDTRTNTHVTLDDRAGSSLTVKVIDGDVVVFIDAGYMGDRGVTLSYTITSIKDVATLVGGLLTATARAASDKGADQ